MNSVTSSPSRDSDTAIYKFVGILIALLILLLVGWLLLNGISNNDHNGQPPVTHGHDTSSPDSAKQSGGANGDTAPSNNGTGTGSSDNSLLGQ
jgi:hypothetical protein